MIFLTNPPRRTVRLNRPKGRKPLDPIVSNVSIGGGKRKVTTASGRSWVMGGSKSKSKTASSKRKGNKMATKSKKKGGRKRAAKKGPSRNSKGRWSSRKARKVAPRSRRYTFRKKGKSRGKVFRTNPPRLSVNSMVSATVDGAKDAVAVIAGQVATRFIRQRIPLSGGTMVQVGLGVASALAAGYVTGMVAPKYARTVIAGGLSDVIRPFIATLPLVGEGVAGDGDALGIGADSFLGDGGMGAYDNSMGAYPALGADSFLGAYAD